MNPEPPKKEKRVENKFKRTLYSLKIYDGSWNTNFRHTDFMNSRTFKMAAMMNSRDALFIQVCDIHTLASACPFVTL